MRLSQLTLLALLVGLFTVVACGSPAKDANPVADAGAASTPASSTHPGPTGTTCTNINETYSICQELSTCPGVIIDPAKFPQCGYSVHGESIDPECLCDGSMCPMGAPATCADMAAILAATTWSYVCAQQVGGHCANESGQGPPSACNVCKQNCGGVPSCLQNCGC